jgi:hypothetical protein
MTSGSDSGEHPEVTYRAKAAEERAEKAEERAQEAEERAVEAEERAVEAGERAVEAEERAVEAEERAREITRGETAAASAPEYPSPDIASYLDSDGGSEPPDGGPE